MQHLLKQGAASLQNPKVKAICSLRFAYVLWHNPQLNAEKSNIAATRML